jgi:hypothetical protein
LIVTNDADKGRQLVSTALDHRAGPELLLGVLERTLEEHRFIAEPLEEVSRSGTETRIGTTAALLTACEEVGGLPWI